MTEEIIKNHLYELIIKGKIAILNTKGKREWLDIKSDSSLLRSKEDLIKYILENENIEIYRVNKDGDYIFIGSLDN
jgi:hypothetical protein